MVDTQPVSGTDDRITPIRRRWRFPRYQPHPDLIALVLVSLLVADFIDRAWHIAAAPRISLLHVAALFLVYLVALWGLWRLTKGAIAYHDANPWIRRGLHQHKHFKRAPDDEHNPAHDLFYHDHNWAFPFHKYILRANHR